MNFSKVNKYPEINLPAVKEIHRQVGDLVIRKKSGNHFHSPIIFTNTRLRRRPSNSP